VREINVKRRREGKSKCRQNSSVCLSGEISVGKKAKLEWRRDYETTTKTKISVDFHQIRERLFGKQKERNGKEKKEKGRKERNGKEKKEKGRKERNGKEKKEKGRKERRIRCRRKSF
jgi:hypothetical protein